MAKPGSHQPLGWPSRLRLNALRKHLHSKFHDVRMAALKEIEAILRKKRGLKRRIGEKWVSARNATVRKATPERLHKALGVAREQKAQKRTAPAPGTPWRAYKPMSGPLTSANLKERDRAARRGERLQPQRGARASGNGQPARKPDLLKQAGLVPRTPGETPAQRAVREEGNRSLPPHRKPADPYDAGLNARFPRSAAEHAREQQARTPSVTPQVPPRAAERAPEKRRWAGLHKRTPGQAPDLTRLPSERVAGRSRTA